MSNIKKHYEEIYAILEANATKKVSTVLPQLLEIMTAKQNAKNYRVNDEGQVTHVFCYYHKEWEDIAECEYGKKANSASGLASMCKEGVKSWNAQQKAIGQLKEQALDLVMKGELEPASLAEWISERELELRVIKPRN